HLLEDYTRVASVLVLLRGELEGLGQSFDVVEYYSPLSRPLAEALGEMLGVPIEIYKGPREENALLIMAWAGDIIGPHESFVRKDPRRTLFAYSVTINEALPLTPEIIGCVSEACAMPWAEQWQVEEQEGAPPSVVQVAVQDEKPLEIAAKILERAHRLES